MELNICFQEDNIYNFFALLVSLFSFLFKGCLRSALLCLHVYQCMTTEEQKRFSWTSRWHVEEKCTVRVSEVRAKKLESTQTDSLLVVYSHQRSSSQQSCSQSRCRSERCCLRRERVGGKSNLGMNEFKQAHTLSPSALHSIHQLSKHTVNVSVAPLRCIEPLAINSNQLKSYVCTTSTDRLKHWLMETAPLAKINSCLHTQLVCS